MTTDLGGVWQAVRAVGGRLVVLGPPGAGKTVMALELVSASLARARASREEPIPILLDLIEWRRGGMHRWLLEGLRDHYRVPVRIGAEMLERNELLVLADSLDAVPEPERSSCAAELEALSRERPGSSVILLSRTEEYEGLPNRLPWPTVEVAMPTPAQVVRYARSAGLTLGKPDEPESNRATQPLTPQVLHLLAVAGPRSAYPDPGTGTSPPLSSIAIRAVRRWWAGVEGRAALEPLVRLVAVELRNRRWWAASLGRLASTGLSQPKLRKSQRMLMIGTTTLVGVVVGLIIGATIGAVRTIVPQGGSRLTTGLLFGALVALADALVTDAALFRSHDPQPPESSEHSATARTRPWLLRLAVIVALAGGCVAIRAVVGEPFAIVAVGTSFGAITGVLSRRLPWRDSVRWSWRSFLRKLLIRLAVVFSAGLALLMFTDHSEALLTALGLGLGLGVTSAMVAGFKRRIAPFPQHEPALASRIGRVMLGGAAIALGAGTVTGLLALTVTAGSPGGGDPARWLVAGWLAALVTGLAASALAATLYGGLELLERWTLASVLERAGIAHRPVGRSLEGLCDGMLLRPAGAGVAFIDRPVLDVLADGTTSRTASAGEGADAIYQAIPS
jgi:hypothetical protein